MLDLIDLLTDLYYALSTPVLELHKRTRNYARYISSAERLDATYEAILLMPELKGENLTNVKTILLLKNRDKTWNLIALSTRNKYLWDIVVKGDSRLKELSGNKYVIHVNA